MVLLSTHNIVLVEEQIFNYTLLPGGLIIGMNFILVCFSILKFREFTEEVNP